MANPNLMSENYIHAFLDGQLSEQQASEVSSYLRSNNEQFREIESYRSINTEIHRLYDSVLDEPVPEFLLEIVNADEKHDNCISGAANIDEFLESDLDYFRQWEDHTANDNNGRTPQEQNPVQFNKINELPAPSNIDPIESEPPTPASPYPAKVRPIQEPMHPHPEQKQEPAAAFNFNIASTENKAKTLDPCQDIESPTEANRVRLESAVEKLDQASSKKIPERKPVKPSFAETYLQTQEKTNSNDIQTPQPLPPTHATESRNEDFALPNKLSKLLEKDISLLEQKANILGQQPSQDNTFGKPSKFNISRLLHLPKQAGLNRPTIVAIWVFMCLAIGWLIFSTLTSPETDEPELITRYAVDAHTVYSREALYAVEMDASNKTELSNWLSSRLDGDISTADISSVGYELMGGRLLPAMGKRAAFFMYKNAKNERISIFISNLATNDTLARFDCEFISRTSVCSWLSKKLSFRVIGDQPLVELQLIAKIIYQQMPHR